jgi:preprotein translocase subunit SecE
MADNTTFLGSLVCARRHKPGQGRIARASALVALIVMAAFGCIDLYQGLALWTSSRYVCITDRDLPAALDPGACPKCRAELTEQKIPAWTGRPWPWGEVGFLGVRIDVRNSITIAAGVMALAVWVIFRTLHWAKVAEFLIETEGELRRVSWPARKEFVGASLVVMILSAALSGFLFGVDWLLSEMLRRLKIGF